MGTDKREKFKMCLNQAPMGLAMGAGVGCCIGLVSSVAVAFSSADFAGMRVRGFFSVLPKYCLSSGAGFAVFMGVGSLVRCIQ
jgi:hypothetical protein